MRKELKQRKKAEAAAARDRERAAREIGTVDAETVLSEQFISAREKRSRAHSLMAAISLERAYENGYWEIEPGLFSRTLSFDDVAYQSSPDAARRRTLREYGAMLNGLTSDYSLQLTLISRRMQEEAARNVRFYSVSDPSYAPFADELNRLLSDQMSEGVSNLVRSRYLTVSCAAASLSEARRKLAQACGALEDSIEAMGSRARGVGGEERVRVIHQILRPDDPFRFSYDELLAGGPSPKEAMLPAHIDFRPSSSANYFTAPGGKCYCALAFDPTGYGQLKDSCLAGLAGLDVPLAVSIHLQPISVEKSRDDHARASLLINAQVISEQEEAYRRHFSGELISRAARNAKAAAEEAEAQLTYGEDQQEFFVGGVVLLWADSIAELRESAEKAVRAARQGGVSLIPMDEMQIEGLNSALPLGMSHLPYERRLFTHQAALLAPFAQEEIWDEPAKGGVYVGQHADSLNLTFIDRTLLDSPGGFVLGQPGKGKSFSSKQEITITALVTQSKAEARAQAKAPGASVEEIARIAREEPAAEIFMLDVKASEYVPLVEALPDAEEVRLYPSAQEAEEAGGKRINPLDLPIWMQLVSGSSPIASQTELLCALVSQSRVTERGGGELTSVESTIIDRCVRAVYAGFEDVSKLSPDDLAPENMPTLSDLHAELRRQPEEEAQALARWLELYTSGSFNSFDGPSTFEFSRRIMSFNISGLGQKMRTWSLLVILNLLINRVYYNFNRGVRTYVYIDEVQALFTSDHVVTYFERCWSEGRAYGLVPTGMSQSVERVLTHPVARYMIKNSGYLLLLGQADDEAALLASLLELSEPQARHIRQGVRAGHGLVRAGGITVPIRGNIPETSSLYRTWNTKPADVLEAKRREFLAAPDRGASE